jgi:hypothetical protein
LFTPQQLGAGNQLCVNNPNGVSAGAACAVAPLITYTDPTTGAADPGVLPGEVGLTWLRTVDMSLGWTESIHFGDRQLDVMPSVSCYNIFNFANFNIPGDVLSGILTGSAGSLNGTNYSGADSVRIGVGTGVFSLGAPRTLEFGLKLTF